MGARRRRRPPLSRDPDRAPGRRPPAPPRDFAQFRAAFYACCIDVLEHLADTGSFSPRRDAAVVVFAISDYTDPEREKAWIKRLNRPALATSFAQWIDALDD